MKTKQIKKVLIFRFGAIGDVVHSTALFRSIKKSYPKTEIHYLTGKVPALLLQNDPDLKKVHICEGKSYKYLLNLAKELKKEDFDVCINLQPSIRTRIFSFFIGAGKNLVYKKTFKLHAVENFWRTAKPVFRDIILDDEIKIYLSEEIQARVSELISKDKTVIGFNTGANNTRQGRKWSIKYWKELAKELIDKYNCEIVLTGSEEDRKLSEQLLDISPNIKSFCGKLTIDETAALLSKCNVVVSGDTGPLHIATAVGTRTIGLYGAAPISRTGIYGNKGISLKSDRNCVPCNRRKCKFIKDNKTYTPCLEDIKPFKVLDIIEKYLK